MTKVVRFHKTGGPEVLQLDDVSVGDPGQGQVRIRHTAIGVNFVDTYQRSGLYPMQLPQAAGNEAAGVVDAVGAGVTDLKAGDRVAYTGLPGSYCEQRLVPADRMVKLPQGVSEEVAASMMLKGLTVHYLTLLMLGYSLQFRQYSRTSPVYGLDDTQLKKKKKLRP